MDWDALSAVGTTAGSLITAITVILAYKQYRLSVTSKLKINIKIEQTVRNNELPVDFIRFDFINRGMIDFCIKEIAIKENGRYYPIQSFFHIDPDSGAKKFPFTVTNKFSVSASISKFELEHFMDIMEINEKNTQKLQFVITDGKGKEYKKRILI
ncbi:hypothetical protein [Merdimonas faecis]|uniref:Uncharacterized protein n=1 Tax=Merdimonas faecis TaxID=1653435 RepID=A0A9D3AJC7_9FIRM|nr:hypothetical protein [Merdimonas faecis]HJH49606.1 hypothetical protein [Merdimonas faecis]